MKRDRLKILIIIGIVIGLIPIKYFYKSTATSKTKIIKGGQNQYSNNLADETVDMEAYLMYEDGSKSDINLIDNKTVVLWNTIIGEGDAGKPSKKVLLVLRGNQNNLNLKVSDTEGLKLTENNFVLAEEKQFTIDNTGCSHIIIQLTDGQGMNLQKEILFECGE
jgi:hypothetical protein